MCVITPLSKRPISLWMLVSLKTFPSTQSVLSHPLQSSNPTSTPLVPFPVVDFPKQPGPRFADPPIVYFRSPHDHVIADHPLPSLPVSKFANPPIVYTRWSKDDSITSPHLSSLAAPEPGITPYASSILVHSSSPISVPTDPIQALHDPSWKQAMNDEITALNRNHT